MFDHNAVERAARFADVKARANRADPIASAATAPKDQLDEITRLKGVEDRLGITMHGNGRCELP